MQANLERAIEIIKTLPPEDFERLDEWIEEQKRNKSKNAEKEKLKSYQIERYKKARKWLDEHSEEYMNQWVCLEGNKLIAHSEDGRDLYQKAKDAGIEIPFIHHIVEEKYPFGGW